MDRKKLKISYFANANQLITREYTTESYHYGPRVRFTITPEGLKLTQKLD